MKYGQCSYCYILNQSFIIYDFFFSPCRPALQLPERRLHPPVPEFQAHRGQAVMEAPAPGPSLQTRQRTIPLTPSSPALKTSRPPLSSPPAHCHPPRSRGIHIPRFLGVDLTATSMVSTVPYRHLPARGVTLHLA